MPSSRCNHIPIVIGVLKQLQPDSILDIGVGFGKWGHLFREYTDIIMSEKSPERYRRENWRCRIDGIEGFETYITPAHRYLYNELFIGDMREVISRVGRYDLVFLGDVIEHVEKADGVELLKDCLAHARKAVVVTTPAKFKKQRDLCGNELEIHRSFWTGRDLAGVGRCVTRVIENNMLVGVLPVDGVPVPVIASPGRKPVFSQVRQGLTKMARCLPHRLSGVEACPDKPRV